MKKISIAFIISAAVMMSASVSAVNYTAADAQPAEVIESVQTECEVSDDTADAAEETADDISGTVIYDTLEDAETAAGFYFDGPYASPEGLPDAEYSVVNGSVLVIRYFNANGDERTVCMSRGADIPCGTADIAAVCDTIKGCDVSMKGTSCGYYSAEWTKGSASFSISTNYAMTLDEMEDAVSALILG